MCGEGTPVLHIGKVAAPLSRNHNLSSRSWHLFQDRHRNLPVVFSRRKSRGRSIGSHKSGSTATDDNHVVSHYSTMILNPRTCLSPKNPVTSTLPSSLTQSALRGANSIATRSPVLM